MNDAAGDFAERAFFGRRRGKALRAGQEEALTAALEAWRFDPSAPPAGRAALAATLGHARRLGLEIGFGGGEHFLHRLGEDETLGLIGVEPFVNSMAKCAARLSEMPALADRARLYDDDAIVVLDALPAGVLDIVWLLYPDPWPKTRHAKRRFTSADNIARIARVLRPGAPFHVASDIPAYIDWTMRHVMADGAFSFEAKGPEDWQTPYAGWPGTRYEAKALREGRRPTYLTFRRR